MCSCGKKTTMPSLDTPSAVDASANGSTSCPADSPAGSASGIPRFEYQGGRTLTVVGQGTGYRYRFVGFGARLSVDPRDRASIAAVPELREVPTYP